MGARWQDGERGERRRLPLMDANSSNPLEASIARLRSEDRLVDLDGLQALALVVSRDLAGAAEVLDSMFGGGRDA